MGDGGLVEDWHGKTTHNDADTARRPAAGPGIRSVVESIIYRELDYHGDNLSGYLADVLVDELGLDLADQVPRGGPDPWDRDSWVAAWGHNATLVVPDGEVPVLPEGPSGTSWLATRVVVRGRPVVELALLRTGAVDGITTLARDRVKGPGVDSLAVLARRLLQGMAD